MRFRTYKNTDLRVSEVGFGLWTISTGWWGQFTEGEAIALLHKALDLGVTLYDAADTYGNGLSEELIAKAFPRQRDEIVIATKVGYDFVTHGESRGRGQREIPQDFSPDAIVRATDAALKRLKTDCIDLYQQHRPDPTTPIEETLRALDDLVKQGKVRAIGCSNMPADQLAAAQDASREQKLAAYVTAQDEYSLVVRGVETALVPTLDHEGMGLLPYFPLASGLLTGKYKSGVPAGSRGALQTMGFLVKNLTDQAKNAAVSASAT